MFSKIDTATMPQPHLSLVERQPEDHEAARKAELRRQMYARIAQGNALAEAEDTARRKWRGQ